MKPKDQITIGLVTAAASIAGNLLYFFKNCLGRSDHILYVIFPLGLIAPIAYTIFLARRKTKPAQLLFAFWFAGWIIYMFLATLNLAYKHNWLSGRLSPAVETFYYYISAITAFPLFAFIFSTWQINPFVRHLITGIIVMGFFWTGLRGLRKM